MKSLSENANVVLSLEFFTNTLSWQCWHYCQICVPTYLQFSPLYAPTDVSKCEIRNQGVTFQCYTQNWTGWF